MRGGRRFPGHVRREIVKKGDFLVIEAAADNIDAFVGEFGLEYDLKKKKDGAPIGEDLSMFEVTVPHGARIEGAARWICGCARRKA